MLLGNLTAVGMSIENSKKIAKQSSTVQPTFESMLNDKKHKDSKQQEYNPPKKYKIIKLLDGDDKNEKN